MIAATHSHTIKDRVKRKVGVDRPVNEIGAAVGVVKPGAGTISTGLGSKQGKPRPAY